MKAAWESSEKNKPPPSWPELGRLKFVNYSLKYREDLDFALKNIDCVINPSEKVGIVGRTGLYSLTLTTMRD